VPPTPIAALRDRYLQRQTTPTAELDEAFARSNSNASKNTYLSQNKFWSLNQASRLKPEDAETQLLFGISISLKDCFDLAGSRTSSGSRFYQSQPAAKEDSTVAARLRQAGAIITGKTHLHQLAYGITGENPDFGDCLQPANASLLTGGSSSGAAASVQEGSALAAIGTDTGGSIRIPAALCGLAGYRSSITLNTPQLWRGGHHLSPAMDTVGWIYRDLRDGPLLAQALFHLDPVDPPPTIAGLRVGTPNESFLGTPEPAVANALTAMLARLTAAKAICSTFDAIFWNTALDIYSPIVALQAAKLHRGNFHHFDPVIAARLEAGAITDPQQASELFANMETFRARTSALFNRFDYLLYPCAPITALREGEDHTAARTAILRYTTPISLAGLPAVTLPFPGGAGLQLIGPLNSDAKLLALSAAFVDLV
jgi:Asp-tRNA(Asn)/Glu-tRNA(Gln) amidotransferase A subunit family amidase